MSMSEFKCDTIDVCQFFTGHFLGEILIKICDIVRGLNVCLYQESLNPNY